MKIAFVSSEVFPYSKTGGLADVAGALPKALEKLGCEVRVFTPKYNIIDENKFDLKYNWNIGGLPVRINGHIRDVHIHQCKLPDSNVEVNFVDCPHYFNRGKIYSNDFDEDERFILFSKGVVETLQRMQWQPDIIHCNDWQTGLLPLFIKDNYSWDKLFDKTSTVYTIHNIGYQGRFSTTALFNAEINARWFYPDGPVEYEDGISFMKAGISFADMINTVSKTYAQEILTPEYGSGMQDILRSRENDLYGIVNGIDYETWNPDTDKFLPYRYSQKYLGGKIKNKKFLLEHLNLPFEENIPVIAMISRMVLQKGFDIFVDATESLMNLNAQWIMLGSGEENYETHFRYLADKYPEKVSVYLGFNNELSHLIEAGADMFLMPSRYEPCGLNQIYSLKYGTVPIVRKTGGLADTVLDWDEQNYYGYDNGTGFSFNDYTGYALSLTVERALKYFHKKDVWKKIQKNGMSQDYSWQHSAKEYMELYKKAIEKRI